MESGDQYPVFFLLRTGRHPQYIGSRHSPIKLLQIHVSEVSLKEFLSRTASSVWTNNEEVIRKCPFWRYHHDWPGRIHHSYEHICVVVKISDTIDCPKKVGDEAYHILSASHSYFTKLKLVCNCMGSVREILYSSRRGRQKFPHPQRILEKILNIFTYVMQTKNGPKFHDNFTFTHESHESFSIFSLDVWFISGLILPTLIRSTVDNHPIGIVEITWISQHQWFSLQIQSGRSNL